MLKTVRLLIASLALSSGESEARCRCGCQPAARVQRVRLFVPAQAQRVQPVYTTPTPIYAAPRPAIAPPVGATFGQPSSASYEIHCNGGACVRIRIN